MPYRAADGFSWRTIDPYTHRRRVIAAIVLVTVGWAIGFFVGRMSAWLFPVAEPDTAARATASQGTSSPPVAGIKPGASAASTPVKEQVAAVSQAPAAASPEKSSQERSSRSDNSPDTSGPHSGNANEEAFTAKNVEPDEIRSGKERNSDVVLVNPQWEQAGPSARQHEPDAKRESIHDETASAKCERRYASFRRSDGTYQPYGRNSRELCPHLLSREWLPR